MLGVTCLAERDEAVSAAAGWNCVRDINESLRRLPDGDVGDDLARQCVNRDRMVAIFQSDVNSCAITGRPNGFAEYWSVDAGGETVKDVAWSYKTPLPENA